MDWNNVYKIKIMERDTNVIKGFKFVRSGRDHLAMATVYWRVGMSRFSETGSVDAPNEELVPDSYELNPDGSVAFNPEDLMGSPFDDEEEDWRTQG